MTLPLDSISEMKEGTLMGADAITILSHLGAEVILKPIDINHPTVFQSNYHLPSFLTSLLLNNTHIQLPLLIPL